MLILVLLAVAGSANLLAAEDAQKPINNTELNVEILSYSWTNGFVLEKFDKTECTWIAKVRNNHEKPRHICINYEFLDEDNLPVFQNGKCEVIQGNSEEVISNSILVYSRLLQDVKKSTVVALEAHLLHTFPLQPPTSQ